MSRELVEGLIAELDGPKSDRAIAMRLVWMQLTQCDDSLPIALLVEGNDSSEPVWIVIRIGAVVHFEEVWRFDLQEHHAVVTARAVGTNEDELP